MVNGDGKRPRGDTTNTSEDVDPEVPGGIEYPPSLHLPHKTSSAPVRHSGCPGSVNQNGEDMSELVRVLLASGKKRELDLQKAKIL